MDSLLIEGWLGGLDREHIIDEASVAIIRERVRAQGAALGMTEVPIARMVNVASELGHNQLRHARRGVIVVRTALRDGAAGLEVIAADQGDGMEQPTDAIRGVPRSVPPGASRPSLGIGVAAVIELADEVDFDVRLGEGTCVWARVFPNLPVRRRQVGIYGRLCKGERVSGDHAGFIRSDDSLLLALADGLGHGPAAREASTIAIATAQARSGDSLERILAQCHVDLAETRGAVLALARIPEPGATIETACVGNVAIHMYGPGRASRWMGSSQVLGSRQTKIKPHVDVRDLGARDVFIAFTDGVTSRADLDGELDLLREHPIMIAHQLFERFARDSDDSLIAVAR